MTTAKRSKVATCVFPVPACLSPTGAVIEVGQKLEYVRCANQCGEGLLVLADGRRVPEIFFDV